MRAQRWSELGPRGRNRVPRGCRVTRRDRGNPGHERADHIFLVGTTARRATVRAQTWSALGRLPHATPSRPQAKRLGAPPRGFGGERIDMYASHGPVSVLA